MPDFTCIIDKYISFLHETSGLNRRIADETPPGTSNKPSIILEINGGDARNIAEDVKAHRHLHHYNLGIEKEGYDQIIECEDIASLTQGLETPSIIERLEPLELGSIVIAHQSETLTAKLIAEFLVSAILILKSGGKTFIVDQIGWQGKDNEAREAIKAVQEEFKKDIVVSRSLLTPVLTLGFTKKIMNNFAQWQCEEIMNAVRRKTSGVCIKEISLNIPVEQGQPFQDMKIKDGKVLATYFADELFVISKLTDKQKQKKKEQCRREKRKKK